MKKHLFISHLAYLALISSLACLLFSCGGGAADEPASVGPEQPVIPDNPELVEHPLGFFPSESPVSRSSSPLEQSHKLFKVWAVKNLPSSASSNDPTIQTVMPGYKVKFFEGTSLWQYDGTSFPNETELDGQFLKYWDESASRYDFYAYAPVVLPNGVTCSYDSDNGFTITGLPTHSTDDLGIIVAKQVRYFPDGSGNSVLRDVDALVDNENETQPTLYYDPVPLVFHNILSKVEYRIYNTGNKTAYINNIYINYDTGQTMDTRGEFINGAWTNFNATSNTLMSMVYIKPNQLEVAPITKDNYKTHSTPIVTYYEIPQDLHQYIHVSVDIDGEVVSKRFDLEKLHTQEGWATTWEYDTYYVYYIHLEVGDSGNDPILIDLSVNDFSKGDPIEDEQTNW